MLPACIISPSTKPSISLPGPGKFTLALRTALEPPGKPLGKASRSYFLRGELMVVGNTKKSQPAAFEVGERIARLIDTVSRLAGRADNREPLAVFSRGDRRAGYRPERHRASARAHVVELLFMHVSGKDVADVSSPHAFLRLRQARDINPL